ncbi:hypothetical protein MHU86_12496 [Fragilaria crotonensis]|nr:hypothetical protein MHU86_12496 [Fragilaria crotonensis]
MSFKNVASALVIVAIIGLVSMAMSRDSLMAVHNSLPVLCDATASAALNNYDSNSRTSRDATAASVPKFNLSTLYSDEHARIDMESTVSRCQKYDLKPYKGPPRRIFFGTMVADENWQVHVIHATEVYDVYHVAVFVESNTTHVASPRPLRYKDSKEGDLLRHSEMFGPKTQVYTDYWLENHPDLKWMDRESEQRNPIVQRWKEAGMLPEDVGIMSDSDEFFSREFLRAVQTCDFPALQPDPSCHYPSIWPVTIAFESSPYCIKKLRWFHPDVIGGQCVHGIGDPTERIVPLRTHDRQYGERHDSYGMDNMEEYPEAVKNQVDIHSLQLPTFVVFRVPCTPTRPNMMKCLMKTRHWMGSRFISIIGLMICMCFDASTLPMRMVPVRHGGSHYLSLQTIWTWWSDASEVSEMKG